MRPGLARGVRLVHDPVRACGALLFPEGALLLDGPALDVVSRCDGRRELPAILASLRQVYDEASATDVAGFLAELTTRRLVTDGGAPGVVEELPGVPSGDALPVGMLAELTYRCPLRCAYCSNPVDAPPPERELTAAQWLDVLGQARALGVLQVHFSGGEPLSRRDLPALITRTRELGMYSNLVTSGLGLTPARMGALVAAGLNHVQLSVQDATPGPADAVAGIRAHDRKLAAAALIREAGLPLTVNAVLHAGNAGHVEAIGELAAALGADRLELAHTQYYGWGLLNRAALVPTADQVEAAGRAAAVVHERHGGRMEIVYVEPDHHTGRAKPCMSGWGARQLVVVPTGEILPCLAAAQLPGPPPPTAHSGTLADAWHRSELFTRYRGTAWMPSPCRDCALRDVDHGGCRCQAYQATGDPAATDPACVLSPHHDEFVSAVPRTGANRPLPVPRRYPCK